MKRLIDSLQAAQSTLLRLPATDSTHQALVAKLRETVPNPVLAHYLRLVEQGRKGVAPVNHGVCTACHMRVPASMLGALLRQNDLVLCENCGCYLHLPESEAKALLPTKPVARAAGAKRPAVAPTAA